MKITFPKQLPISQRHEEIAELIKTNQVVVIAGETGSGKTTQIPKICLKLGLAENGLIAHTQPRRIAARTVAERIASELETPLGEEVGYQIRFTDVSSKQTQVKLMTDGVLLQEIQRDKNLRNYSAIIIDEAHERSLNIDFLLGLLKPLCRRRPDLKLIITSATIDLEKFAQHFSSKENMVPIIEVSGRTYPVDILYRPEESHRTDLANQIADTLDELVAAESSGELAASGDVLVFCAGEREIREASEAISRLNFDLEILPLYARLSVAEQSRVFKPSKKRKVILATNVAETSITVPGIAYVIDPGLARISRYSFRSKIQRLPIEPISQASAQQRSGRSGRVANGVCVRLYSQEDFEQRPPFTQAEILRSNLGAVILRMLRLGIKDVYGFDFLDKPDRRLLNDGFKLLQELGAIDQQKRLTSLGRHMSDLSIDPKYARVLIEANKLGCLREAIVLVSGLSIQDPRERPSEAKAAADQMHAHLHHPKSDFSSLLILWQAIQDAKSQLSNTQFKAFCRGRYWSLARVFEWRELVGQLSRQCKSLKWSLNAWQAIELPYQCSSPPSLNDLKQKVKNKQFNTNIDDRYSLLHRAILSGLISHIARKTSDADYQGARTSKLLIFPGSGLAKSKPKWLLSAELIETSRLFAHNNAEIKPDWIAAAAPHLCRFRYSDPLYHKRSGSIKANRATLMFGLVVTEREMVNYSPINFTESRTIFIQSALVDGEYQPRAPQAKRYAQFVQHNAQLIRDIEKLETKTRKRNLLVSEQRLFEFYDARLADNIASRTDLEKWLAKGHHNDLKLNENDVLASELDHVALAQFPDHITINGKRLTLSYRFQPGQVGDGVNLDLPIVLLAHFPEWRGEWLVPGLLHEKCVALIKTLPKPIRRNFAPAIATIENIADQLNEPSKGLTHVLADALFKYKGVQVSAKDFDITKLDPFYFINYRLIDQDGALIEESRDIQTLKKNYASAVSQSLSKQDASERVEFEQLGMGDWDCGDIPETFDYSHAGMTVRAYPTLEFKKNQLNLILVDRLSRAQFSLHQSSIDLGLHRLKKSQASRYLLKTLLPKTSSSEQQNQKQGLSALANQLQVVKISESDRDHWRAELLRASLKASCFSELPIIRSKAVFDSALERGQKQWVAVAMEMETTWDKALQQQHQLLKTINATSANSMEQDRALEDIKAQLYRLFANSKLRYLDQAQMRSYSRYLKTISLRLEKLKGHSQLEAHQASYDKVISALNKDASLDEIYFCHPALLTYEFMLEEWRVSLFAQQLKTRFPISEKRLKEFWQQNGLADLAEPN